MNRDSKRKLAKYIYRYDRKRRLRFFIFFIIFIATVIAAVIAGKYLLEVFLLEAKTQDLVPLYMGTGTRALGMAGNFVSMADDVTTVFWNPAGLAEAGVFEASVGYCFYFPSLYGIHLIVAGPTGEETGFGFAWIRYFTEKLEATDVTGNTIGSYSDVQDVVMASYAFALLGMPLLKTMEAGITAKFLRHSLYKKSGNGIGLDVGVLKRFQFISFGFTAQDIWSSIKWNTSSGLVEKLPVKLSFGATLDLAAAVGEAYRGKVTLAVRNMGDTWKPGIAFEYVPIKILKIYGGIRNLWPDADRVDFAFGAMLAHSIANFSYAGMITRYFVRHEFNISRPLVFGKAALSPEERKKLSKKHYLKAKELLNAKKYEEAKQELEKALEYDPKNFAAKVMLKRVEKLLRIFRRTRPEQGGAKK